MGWGGIITSLTRPHMRDATGLYALLRFIHMLCATATVGPLALPHIRHATLLYVGSLALPHIRHATLL